jgi:hypothetical protein
MTNTESINQLTYAIFAQHCGDITKLNIGDEETKKNLKAVLSAARSVAQAVIE